jgi:hypothetical protein
LRPLPKLRLIPRQAFKLSDGNESSTPEFHGPKLAAFHEQIEKRIADAELFAGFFDGKKIRSD